MVGNGAWGGECAGDDAQLEFLHGHGAVSDRLYKSAKKACTASPTGAACYQLQGEADSMAEGLNGYDFYRDCFAQDTPPGDTQIDWAALRKAGGDFSTELIKTVKAPRPPVRPQLLRLT